MTKCQRFVKLKELQADTQANAFAAHLILPNRTQSPPTTRNFDANKYINKNISNSIELFEKTTYI